MRKGAAIRLVSRRAVLGGMASAAGAAILAACGGTSATDTPKAAATTASTAATSAAPAVNAAATTVSSAVSGAAPTVASAATAAAPTINAAATTVIGAATSAAPTVNAATTAVTGTVAASGSAVAASPYTGKKLNVAYVPNGNLGDKSFFDSGQRGMDRAKAELGMAVKTIELGNDQNKWGPGLADAASQNYDVIICGTSDMEQYISETAAKATSKKFIFFDDSVDYSKGGFQNVYSVMFKQNEGSYLAGFMAGLLVQSTDPNVLKGTGGGKKIGFLGGSNIPVINDFLAGWKQGAIDAGLKDTDVLVSYVEGQTPFADPAKGKELTLAMYNQGAGIAFNVAGSSGLGLLDAGGQAKRFTIGVDSDQYTILKDSKPDQAQWIVTSMQKRVDNALYRALRMAGDGTLKYGAAEALGLTAGGVELADNENYQKLVPQAIRDKVTAKSKDVASGAVKVNTAIK